MNEYNLIDIIRYYIKNAKLGVYGNTDIVWYDERPQPTNEQIEEWKISYPIDIQKDNKQFKIKQLLLESDYIELPSFIERKGQEIYNTWIEYRTSLRLAYHNFELPIPEKPE